MRVTLDALLVLDAIDRAGSFAAAAEQLNRVPSAVSYTIQKLEQDLGVAIFDRSGHRAKLTSAGTQLLKDGRDLLSRAEAVERKVRDVGAGCGAHLTIAVADVVLRSAVYSLFRSFHEAPDHQATRLRISIETQAKCWASLIAGRSDLVIGAQEPSADVEGFRTQTLGDVELSLVVPAAHPLAAVVEPVTCATCAQYRFVRQEAWPLAGSTCDVREELFTADGCESELEAIRQGVGIGYAPAYLVTEDVAAGRLVTKSVVDGPRLHLTVAWRATRAGAGVAWFLEQLRDHELRARLLPRLV